METKRQLREKILHLEHRVDDLEERLCPCESHQWKFIGTRTSLRFFYTDMYYYKCSRCGKKISTVKLLTEET